MLGTEYVELKRLNITSYELVGEVYTEKTEARAKYPVKYLRAAVNAFKVLEGDPEVSFSRDYPLRIAFDQPWKGEYLLAPWVSGS